MAGNLKSVLTLAMCNCGGDTPHALISRDESPIVDNLLTKEMCVEAIEELIRQNVISKEEARVLKSQVKNLNLPEDYGAFLSTLPAEEKNRIEKIMNQEPRIEKCDCDFPLFHIRIVAQYKKYFCAIVSNGCACRKQAYSEIDRMLNDAIITKEQADKLRADIAAVNLPQTPKEVRVLYNALPESARKAYETGVMLRKLGMNVITHLDPSRKN